MPPRPTRIDSAIGLISDRNGIDWLVAEARPTEHGFSIYLGWPQEEEGQRGVTIILTNDLAEYLCATRARDVRLPIGRTVMIRLRKVLGQDWWRDRDAWWAARADDLATLTLEQFAARHGGSPAAAWLRRKAMVVDAP